MKRCLSFFIKYFLFWFCFFILFKLLFLVANTGKTAVMGWGDFFRVFLYGSKMDLSAAGYFTLFPGLLLVFTTFINPGIIEKIIKWYTWLMLILLTIFGLSDIGLYPSWGTRLNTQILPYLANPEGIIASVTLWQVLLFLVTGTGIIFLFTWLYNKIFSKIFSRGVKPSWFVSPVILFLTLALIIPIRGGVNTSPLNFSSVYFSQNLYANHSAYNFFWSFSHALLHNKVKANPVHYFDDEKCKSGLSGIEQLNQEDIPVFINKLGNEPVNIILVILESFSNKIIEPLGGLPDVTPRINQLCSEGILFSSFYATGTRSDKGISSLIGSYPSLIKASSIILFPEKMKKLSYLPDYFRKKGYDLSFYYGGDVNFYNTRILLTQSGVDKIISRTDFPLQVATMQKWGVPDGYLYQRMFDDLQKMKQPFFSMVYTVSSHEPFDLSFYNRIKDKSYSGKYCNSASYADSCLGNFIDRLKDSPLWKNTLVVITADHATPGTWANHISGPCLVSHPATLDWWCC